MRADLSVPSPAMLGSCREAAQEDSVLTSNSAALEPTWPVGSWFSRWWAVAGGPVGPQARGAQLADWLWFLSQIQGGDPTGTGTGRHWWEGFPGSFGCSVGHGGWVGGRRAESSYVESDRPASSLLCDLRHIPQLSHFEMVAKPRWTGRETRCPLTAPEPLPGLSAPRAQAAPSLSMV